MDTFRSKKTTSCKIEPRQVNMVTSTDLKLYELEHEDTPRQFVRILSQVTSNTWKGMIWYEFNFEAKEWHDAPMGHDERLKARSCRYSRSEPHLDAKHLHELNAMADQCKIQRLKSLQVFSDPPTLPSDAKKLSTRFMRASREKHDAHGNPGWLHGNLPGLIQTEAFSPQQAAT